MKIIHIEWLDEPTREGELKITDGKNVILVFCHPCAYEEGQEVSEYLVPFLPEGLQLSDSEITKIEKLEGSYFGYTITARIIDFENSIIAVDNLMMRLENPIPSWATDGDIIQFKTHRVDLY